MHRLTLLFISFFVLNCSILTAQEQADSIIFIEKQKLFGSTEYQSRSELFTKIGKSFIETPYVAATLEKEGDESLVVNLHGLDCTTFVESCIALTNTFSSEEKSYDIFQNKLKAIRYRNGILNGYTSRLHYFSEWILNNKEKGIIEDVTKKVGGVLYPVSLNFMSTHPQFYRQLKADSTLIPIIAMQEKQISEREFYFIPKENVEKIERELEEGMIVGITTNKEGLDIAHTGILVKENGRVHLLHASSDFKKVMVSEKPLADYLMGNKSQNGIMVLKIKGHCW